MSLASFYQEILNKIMQVIMSIITSALLLYFLLPDARQTITGSYIEQLNICHKRLKKTYHKAVMDPDIIFEQPMTTYVISTPSSISTGTLGIQYLLNKGKRKENSSTS